YKPNASAAHPRHRARGGGAGTDSSPCGNESSLGFVGTIVVGGSFGAVYASVRRKLGLIGRDRVKANSERFTVASEALGGIKDVKVLGVEDAFLRRFIEPSYKFARHQATSQAIAYVPRYAVETIAFGTVIL